MATVYSSTKRKECFWRIWEQDGTGMPLKSLKALQNDQVQTAGNPTIGVPPFQERMGSCFKKWEWTGCQRALKLKRIATPEKFHNPNLNGGYSRCSVADALRRNSYTRRMPQRVRASINGSTRISAKATFPVPNWSSGRRWLHQGNGYTKGRWLGSEWVRCQIKIWISDVTLVFKMSSHPKCRWPRHSRFSLSMVCLKNKATTVVLRFMSPGVSPTRLPSQRDSIHAPPSKQDEPSFSRQKKWCKAKQHPFLVKGNSLQD